MPTTDEKVPDDGQVPSPPTAPSASNTGTVHNPSIEDPHEVPDADDNSATLENECSQTTGGEAEEGSKIEKVVAALDLTHRVENEKATEAADPKAESRSDRPGLSLGQPDSGFFGSTSSSEDASQAEIHRLTEQLCELQLKKDHEVESLKKKLQEKDREIESINKDLEAAKGQFPDLSPRPDFCFAFLDETFEPCPNRPEPDAMMCADHRKFPLLVSTPDNPPTNKGPLFKIPSGAAPQEFPYALGVDLVGSDPTKEDKEKKLKCYYPKCGAVAYKIYYDEDEDKEDVRTPLCRYHNKAGVKPISSFSQELYGNKIYGRFFPEKGIYDSLPAGRLLQQRFSHSNPVTAADHVGYLYIFQVLEKRLQQDRQNSENQNRNLFKIGKTAPGLERRKKQHECKCEKISDFVPFTRGAEETTVLEQSNGELYRYVGLFERLLHGIYVLANDYNCICNVRHGEWFKQGDFNNPKWSLKEAIDIGVPLLERLKKFYPLPEHLKKGPRNSVLAPKDRILAFNAMQDFYKSQELTPE
ncbi:hypothetical protein EMPS_09865 [Entomortierella parvispora]|uniref:Bacteriophage T5 Orf172 DNA-binding domain-containing protein n=1 Tax=Entomortierella parvispora TaxID=205924 RepID=A0A9P3HJ10_9FUNG|nr:hypothetical protein EMPS_09865 [Entomortierella parvispora]